MTEHPTKESGEDRVERETALQRHGVEPPTKASGALSDGPLTPWAFLVFVLAVVGLFGLVLWRVMEATLLRLH